MPKFLITSGDVEEVIEAKNRGMAINRFVKNNSDKSLGSVIQGCEIQGDLFYVLTEHIKSKQKSGLKIISVDWKIGIH